MQIMALLKSVHIYQSYCKKNLAQFFWPTLYIVHCTDANHGSPTGQVWPEKTASIDGADNTTNFLLLQLQTTKNPVNAGKWVRVCFQ